MKPGFSFVFRDASTMRRTDAGRYIKKNAHGMKESADNGSASKIDTRFLPSRLYELPKFPSMAAAPDNKRPAKRTRGPRFIMLSLFKSFRFSYIGGEKKKSIHCQKFSIGSDGASYH